MYASKDKLQYPIIDEVTKLIREKTQEELKIEGIITLDDGEYVENGKLIKVEYDEKLGYYKKAWDKENHIWYEGTTHDEFVKMRADKILEYSQLEEDKKALENSKFSTQEEIQFIVEKMQALEKEVVRSERDSVSHLAMQLASSLRETRAPRVGAWRS